MRFANFLAEMGNAGDAEETYTRALDRMESEAAFHAGDIYRIYRFHMSRGQVREAMETMIRGEGLLPGHAGIKITLDDLYRRQGITYKAREMYEAALLVDPGSSHARRRLEQL